MVYSPCEQKPFFGDLTGHEWDTGDGRPGIHQFGNALQVWAVMREGPASVVNAALAFNVHPEMIMEAVEEHDWMYLAGDAGNLAQLFIEQDGE